MYVRTLYTCKRLQVSELVTLLDVGLLSVIQNKLSADDYGVMMNNSIC